MAGHDMTGQTASIYELLFARLTHIRFLTRMGPHVRGQVVGLRERHPTTLEFTLPWFLPCMCQHVRGQAAGVREQFATPLIFALKGFLTRMGPHVPGQVVGL